MSCCSSPPSSSSTGVTDRNCQSTGPPRPISGAPGTRGSITACFSPRSDSRASLDRGSAASYSTAITTTRPHSIPPPVLRSSRLYASSAPDAQRLSWPAPVRRIERSDPAALFAELRKDAPQILAPGWIAFPVDQLPQSQHMRFRKRLLHRNSYVGLHPDAFPVCPGNRIDRLPDRNERRE